MLLIRKAQMETLRKAAQQGFENKMLAHLNRFFPDACAAMAESGTREIIRYGIGRAKRNGFESEREVCKYIDVMVVFGRDFDRDTNLPWATEILSDKTIMDNKARMDRLITYAMAHADKKELKDAR